MVSVTIKDLQVITTQPVNQRLIVVKSSQHFYASFSQVARRVIYVAAPGSVTADLRSLPYRKASRALWPLQPDAGKP